MTTKPVGDPVGVEAIRAAMRRDLVAALKARAMETVAALRTALAAIDNAEAVDTSELPDVRQDGPVASATVGLGSSEMARRVLSAADTQSVVATVISEYLDEADRYEAMNHDEAAEGLRRQAEVLRFYVS